MSLGGWAGQAADLGLGELGRAGVGGGSVDGGLDGEGARVDREDSLFLHGLGIRVYFLLFLSISNMLFQMASTRGQARRVPRS